MTAKEILSVAQLPPIAVIQGAYQKFDAPESKVTVVTGFKYQLVQQRTYASVPAKPGVSDWLRFQRLRDEWKASKSISSSTLDLMLSPAYQGIIGLGQPAVAFILAELRSEGQSPNHWFWALKAITGLDPVKREDRGNIPKMAQAWLSHFGA